jgi:hypothetical protein
MTNEKDERGPETFPGTVATPSAEETAGSADASRDGRDPRSAGEGLRILALDAGNATGTALYSGGGLVQGVVRGRAAVYELLANVEDLDALAYERFTIRQGLKEEHADVVYINGAVEHEAARRGIPFYFYTPRQSKSRISDELLQSLGWWPNFGLRTGGHAVDATRILLCTLTDHYPQEMMEK